MQPKFAPLYTYPNLPSPSSIIVCCLNVHGLSSNHQYLELLLNDNNIQKIQELHSDYRFLAACLPCQEHPLFCTPQLLSGHGGVAIGWNSQLGHLIKPTPIVSSHQMLGIDSPQLQCLYSQSTSPAGLDTLMYSENHWNNGTTRRSTGIPPSII